MAYLNLEGARGSFFWQVAGLGNVFNTSYYNRAGISRNNFSDGASSISNIVTSEYAPSSNSVTRTSYNVYNQSAGTYTFYGFAQARNGLYYRAGSGSVTVQSNVVRPSNFYWSGVSSGSRLISASEWNRFTDKINDFNRFKGRSTYSFTRASSGNRFFAYMFNEARNQISNMTSVSVSTKSTGEVIRASDFIALETALNRIN